MNRNWNGLSINIIIVILIFMFYFFIAPITCTDEDGARDALIKAGYHPIEVGGYAYFTGLKNDAYVTKFKTYTADSSQIITGVVTTDLTKRKRILID